MKAVSRWLLFEMLVASLICRASSLHAQPASESALAGSESTSPSDGQPATTQSPTGPADDKPVVADDPDKPWSQGVSAENRYAARELFLEGNRRFRIPLFTKAAEKYAAALTKWKHPAFYFNLAIAQLNLGQEVDARENLENALKYGEEPLGADQFQEAQKQLREVERQLGRIRVTCSTEGAEVILDGVRLFTSPGSYEGWAKAKSHEIMAQKAGYLSESRQVTVSSGQLQQVHLKLITLSEAADASRRWSVWKPWAVVAAGGAIAAAGGMLHRRSSTNFNTFDARFLQLECGTDKGEFPGCTKAEVPPELTTKLRRARQQQVLAAGSYVAGGVLVATGIALLYLNQPRLDERSNRYSARSISAAPIISSDMVGVQMTLGH